MINMNKYVKKKRKFNGIEYEYVSISNEKKNNTIVLPGWQQNVETYETMYKTISKYSNIYIIHFPGFINTVEPNRIVGLDYYVLLVKDLIEGLNLCNLLIIGHSFGGRVAIKLQSIYKSADYLLLVSSAGIKSKNILTKIKILKYKVKKKIYKKINKVKLQKLIEESGSKDFKQLSYVMKKTFIKIVNEDLTKHLKKIDVPVLLMWGSQDKTTPLWMAKKFSKKIKNSQLIVLKGCRHFSFLESKGQFNIILNAFYQNIWGDSY